MVGVVATQAEGLYAGLDVRLSDDAGTEYVWMGGGGGGNYCEDRIQCTYTPAPPDGATGLEVAILDAGQPVGRVDLPL